jgi:hypothetical protein
MNFTLDRMDKVNKSGIGKFQQSKKKLSFYIQWEMICKIHGIPEILKNQNRGKSAVRTS